MKIMSSYGVKIKDCNHNMFRDFVTIYRDAVSFFIDVCSREWDSFLGLSSLKRIPFMESLTHATKKNPNPKYDFGKADKRFYKMPSGYRRAVMQAAIGSYSSYFSNLQNWKENPVGKEPTLQFDRNLSPVFYYSERKGDVYSGTLELKLYYKHDWVWVPIRLNRQDVKYLNSHCKDRKICSPSLQKKGKCWYLVYPFEEHQDLCDTDIEDQLVCAVDLGINKHAVCSILRSDGTVVGRKFIDFPMEKDHLYKAVNRVKKAQQHGATRCPNKWKHVRDINTDISRKVANAIIAFAVLYSVDVIVFEHLDTKGKKKGSKKQRLVLWRHGEIQTLVEHKAHRLGMRIRRVCAKNTSKFAFDGSGEVSRGTYLQNGEEKYNYSICIFPSGKQYHCDLNASYNIGARYFVRELLKSDKILCRLPGQTNVSDYGTGTTRTLSTLIRLHADTHGLPCAI